MTILILFRRFQWWIAEASSRSIMKFSLIHNNGLGLLVQEIWLGLVCLSLKGYNGLPRSIIHRRVSFPLLRKPSLVIIPLWVAYWERVFNKLFVIMVRCGLSVAADNGPPRSFIFLINCIVALRRCNPSYSLFPCFVSFRVLMDLTKTQYRIWKDVDLCALKIDVSWQSVSTTGCCRFSLRRTERGVARPVRDIRPRTWPHHPWTRPKMACNRHVGTQALNRVWHPWRHEQSHCAQTFVLNVGEILADVVLEFMNIADSQNIFQTLHGQVIA